MFLSMDTLEVQTVQHLALLSFLSSSCTGTYAWLKGYPLILFMTFFFNISPGEFLSHPPPGSQPRLLFYLVRTFEWGWDFLSPFDVH
jgi:hypothetical protein